MPVYKQKPHYVEAWQFNPDTEYPDWVISAIKSGSLKEITIDNEPSLLISARYKTSGAPVSSSVVSKGHWIVRDKEFNTFFYTISDEDFKLVYEKI